MSFRHSNEMSSSGESEAQRRLSSVDRSFFKTPRLDEITKRMLVRKMKNSSNELWILKSFKVRKEMQQKGDQKRAATEEWGNPRSLEGKARVLWGLSEGPSGQRMQTGQEKWGPMWVSFSIYTAEFIGNLEDNDVLWKGECTISLW